MAFAKRCYDSIIDPLDQRLQRHVGGVLFQAIDDDALLLCCGGVA
jgi:hypothetical protein